MSCLEASTLLTSVCLYSFEQQQRASAVLLVNVCESEPLARSESRFRAELAARRRGKHQSVDVFCRVAADKTDVRSRMCVRQIAPHLVNNTHVDQRGIA